MTATMPMSGFLLDAGRWVVTWGLPYCRLGTTATATVAGNRCLVN